MAYLVRLNSEEDVEKIESVLNAYRNGEDVREYSQEIGHEVSEAIPSIVNGNIFTGAKTAQEAIMMQSNARETAYMGLFFFKGDTIDDVADLVKILSKQPANEEALQALQNGEGDETCCYAYSKYVGVSVFEADDDLLDEFITGERDRDDDNIMGGYAVTSEGSYFTDVDYEFDEEGGWQEENSIEEIRIGEAGLKEIIARGGIKFNGNIRTAEEVLGLRGLNVEQPNFGVETYIAPDFETSFMRD